MFYDVLILWKWGGGHLLKKSLLATSLITWSHFNLENCYRIDFENNIQRIKVGICGKKHNYSIRNMPNAL